MSRPSWDEYFMQIAYLVATRSTCERRQVGAVIILNRNILATGYNGAPVRVPHCAEAGGCLRIQLNVPSGERHEICRGAHAEQNAIAQAARNGVSINGATLYCKNMPCSSCAKSIINSGIVEVYYREGYGDDLALTMLKDAGIPVIQKLPENV